MCGDHRVFSQPEEYLQELESTLCRRNWESSQADEVGAYFVVIKVLIELYAQVFQELKATENDMLVLVTNCISVTRLHGFDKDIMRKLPKIRLHRIANFRPCSYSKFKLFLA